jgi:hypothetical protein
MPPQRPFNVTARVYQPKKAMLDGHTKNNLVVRAGTYQIPPIQKASNRSSPHSEFADSMLTGKYAGSNRTKVRTGGS